MAKGDHDRPMGRRDFFRSLWPGARDEASSEPTAKRRPVMPLGPVPPCLRLGDRLENPCLDCEAPCLAVCEPDIIRRHGKEHALAGRAYLDFERAGCTWCGECLEVCPATPAPERRPDRIGVALLNRETCMPHQGVVCIACQSICPREAILFDERGRPTVHPRDCDGCGMCVAPCPTDALMVVPENPAH